MFEHYFDFVNSLHKNDRLPAILQAGGLLLSYSFGLKPYGAFLYCLDKAFELLVGLAEQGDYTLMLVIFNVDVLGMHKGLYLRLCLFKSFITVIGKAYEKGIYSFALLFLELHDIAQHSDMRGVGGFCFFIACGFLKVVFKECGFHYYSRFSRCHSVDGIWNDLAAVHKSDEYLGQGRVELCA